ncbi:TonB C-terminal domain-containing protein [Chitiniphilus purpureus]|uniref:TonB C-terminal domain-containing protein n=1 Tax=Chitiniphilus purpureus TaxID=2981137 RepID=A0ABY6DQ84_9NEIS|nr:energy transducer TonB [Chitiniphilus sp. CD1]UXY15641.1 TonB C-terminal domain-containing protein [Chitiniphilus sp. CD1]
MNPRQAINEREAHRGLSLMLALVVHVLFVVFLLVSVQWQTQPPQPVEVELWGPPPAPETQPRERPVVRELEPQPEPVPEPDPEIATQKVKPPKPTPTPQPRPTATPAPKPTPTPAKPQPTPKPQKKASELDEALSLDNLLKPGAKPQPQGRSGGEGSNPQAPADSPGRGSGRGLGDDYRARVAGLIRSRTAYDDSAAGNPSAVYRISLLPSGEIQSAELVRSNGDAAYNEATHRAIMGLRQFPPLPSGKPFSGSERQWTITFRLRD